MTLPPWGKWALAHVTGVLWAGIAVAVLVWGYEERRAGKIGAERDAAKSAQQLAEASANRSMQAAAAALEQKVKADAAFHAKQAVTASLADRYRARRDSLSAQLAAAPGGAPPLLAPVLARCDSLAAAATDTLPCHARVAARDSAVAALQRAKAATDSANTDLKRQLKLQTKATRWLFGLLPRPKCVGGVGGVVSASGHVAGGAGVLCGLPF